MYASVLLRLFIRRLVENWLSNRKREDVGKTDPAWLEVYEKMDEDVLRRALVGRLMQLDRWPPPPKIKFKDLSKRRLMLLCSALRMPEPGSRDFVNLWQLVPEWEPDVYNRDTDYSVM